jgi:hypothetical protein
VRGSPIWNAARAATPYPSTVRRLAAALRLNESVLTRLWQARTVEQRPAHGSSAPAQHVRHNLPAEVSSFVGREQDVIEVAGLLERSRLLPLTGVGGIGKTRLALRVGTVVVDAYDSGAWLHDLVGLSDPRLLAASVVRCLGFQESRRPALDTLIDALKVTSAPLCAGCAVTEIRSRADCGWPALCGASGGCVAPLPKARGT